MGQPPSGLGEQESVATPECPYPCTPLSFHSGGTTAWTLQRQATYYASASLVSKDRANFIELFLQKFKICDCVHSFNGVYVPSRISFLRDMKHGHSISICGMVSSSSSQNLHVGSMLL